jgi:Fe-S-cluster containining protein
MVKLTQAGRLRWIGQHVIQKLMHGHLTPVRRFACTACGACCNRSPEVLLNETLTVSDIFVFRLQFRLYRLPRVATQHRSGTLSSRSNHATLAAFAAAQRRARWRSKTETTDGTDYLVISAIALNIPLGVCAALGGNLCTIYDRRPVACRSVPFHYARSEPSFDDDLTEFTSRPGYLCASSDDAPVVLDEGKLVSEAMLTARSEALRLASDDQPWTRAIVKAMRGDPNLPTFRQIEASMAVGVLTASMRAGWQVALDVGLIDRHTYGELVEQQLRLIDRELLLARCSDDDRATLQQMQAEYRQHRTQTNGARDNAIATGHHPP